MTAPVVHHPPGHPYVRHVAPAGPGEARSVWDLDEVAASGASVVHLHFGFEHLTLDELADWLRQLRRHRLALVVTVHDLENPHLVDQSGYSRLLELLVADADAVITLTPWAAAVIERLDGRAVHVIPHPHVVPLLELRRRPRRRPRQGVYVHAATCRPNLDVELITTVAAAAEAIGGVRVHVRDPLTPSAQRVVARLRQHELVHLDIAPRLTDRELWTRIERAQVVLLPYRWGTHSGLLETATDLGTPCIAPAVGAHLDQGAVEIHPADPAAALHRALLLDVRCDLGARARQRVAVADAHQRVYSSVLDRIAGAA